VSPELRGKILVLLKSGPKTPDELRELVLHDVPEDQYKTRYQGYRRAMEDLIRDGMMDDAKYVLRGEAADQKYIRASMQRFEQTDNKTKQSLLMEDIEAECKKRNAIHTPRLLMFLKERLSDQNEEIRKHTISSLRDLTSRIDESRRQDVPLLKRMRLDYARKLLELASKDTSFEIRREAFKLLLELGETKLTAIVENIVKEYPSEQFLEFKQLLKRDVCTPFDPSGFSKNRYLRDHKDDLRVVLEDIAVSPDGRLVKRARFILFGLRYGPTNSMPGENEVD
jgi:hypothetical protein